jgi:FkbM family methyltransferase
MLDWKLYKETATALSVDKIVAVDVGARWGIGDRWQQLGDLVEIFGFDPDPAECERLNATSPKNVHYVPLALGESTRAATLYISADPACSSLYPPIPAVSELLHGNACIAAVGAETVALQSFDNWQKESRVGAVSVMKLDTQGSELGVLQGAEQALRDVQLLEIEVEFNPLYEGQPLFGDVDKHLRQRGFTLWQLAQTVHYSNRHLHGAALSMPEVSYFDSKPTTYKRGAGQLFWAHAYYTRAEFSPAARDTVGLAQGMHAACVAAAYGLDDLAYIALQKIDPGPAAERVERLKASILRSNQSVDAAGPSSIAAAPVRHGVRAGFLQRLTRKIRMG